MAAIIIKGLDQLQVNQIMMLIENGKMVEWFNDQKLEVVPELTDDNISIDFEKGIVEF